MTQLDRRDFLLAGAATLLGNSAVSAAEPPAPPAIPVPAEWNEAMRIPLWPGRPPGGAGFAPGAVPADWPASHLRAVAMPDLRVFRPRQSNGRAVLVMPGGAYWFVSFVNEGVDVARAFTERGFTVFVLTYRLPGEGWAARADVPLQDAQRALRVIRSKARAYAVDAGNVGVVGFSAGGHLAATLATSHAERAYEPLDAVDRLSAQPHAVGLIYPVVTLRDPYTHELSRRLLLGEQPSSAAIDRRSAELHVTAATPPLFLVHALDDTAVPVENSVRLLDALRKAGRPVEAHLLQQGGHAFGVGRPGTPASKWIDTFSAWLP